MENGFENRGAPDDAAPGLAAPRRSLRKRLRRWIALRLVGLAVAVLPRLYLAYMWLVEVTSRHDDRALRKNLFGCLDRYDRCVAALWHQEVFTVAWNYRIFGGHTLASTGDFGELITEMLRLCNFVVFRGGSGSKSRRRKVLPLLIHHMRKTPRVVYGITVDGSRGPVFHMKPGAIAIAQACRAPVVLVRTTYRRAIHLPTWDRSEVPLPFSRRLTLATGPYWVPPGADHQTLERFRQHLENELLELTERAHRLTHGRSAPRRGFPEGWQPGWAPDQFGRPFGPHDLDLDTPPPWAHQRGK